MEKVSKELLRDVLKQVMEDKLQETLGYTSENTESGKNQNYRIGYSKKDEVGGSWGVILTIPTIPRLS